MQNLSYQILADFFYVVIAKILLERRATTWVAPMVWKYIVNRNKGQHQHEPLALQSSF